jgi:cellulose synthase/poly-beta-1,6-N-acetylglucosamine synthase-like glycosyltransferase
LARAAGAEVFERRDAARRGKGYALSFAFDAILCEDNTDAVVVVDADTSISSNLLHAFDREIVAGHSTLQAHYDVRDAAESWRTRLASLALVLFHGVRSLGREALGVSCGLRGNGMCFSVAQLRAVPHAAFSLVEDLEYGIALGLAGSRVRYVADAAVSGDMPVSSEASRTQRARWEGGRRAIRRQHAIPLLRRAMRDRSPLLLDLAIDLLVPPLTTVFVFLAAGTAVAVAACILSPAAWSLSLLAWGVADAGFLLYIARGCVMTGHFWRAVRDLAWAPVFMLWKLSVRAAAGVAGEEWVRTGRTTLRKGDG